MTVVVFRTDASPTIGGGHLMRCAALADALLQQAAQVCFLVGPQSGAVPASLAGRVDWRTLPASVADGISAEDDARRTLTALDDLKPDWVVVDHYQLAAAWESQVHETTGARLLAIDDLTDRPHRVDAMLDPNLRLPGTPQPLAGTATVFSGPRYAPMRPEFARLAAAALQRRQQRHGRIERLFVGYGAADSENETAVAIAGVIAWGRQQTAQGKAWQADVVAGPASPHVEALRAMCASEPRLELLHAPADYAERLAAADLALGAGGSTNWERCALGVPALVTLCSDNQRAPAVALAQAGGIRIVGEHPRTTPDDYTRALAALTAADCVAMSQRALEVCDGRGAERLASWLMSSEAR